MQTHREQGDLISLKSLKMKGDTQKDGQTQTDKQKDRQNQTDRQQGDIISLV
jgi:hypothetical protein